MSCSSLGWLLARQVSQVKSKRDLLSPFRTRNLNGTERAEATTLRYRSLALGNDPQPKQVPDSRTARSIPPEILRRMRTATLDMRPLELDSTVASTILNIRSRQGEPETDAALARLAALPKVWKIQ
jgi:hypothetical protein